MCALVWRTVPKTTIGTVTFYLFVPFVRIPLTSDVLRCRVVPSFIRAGPNSEQYVHAVYWGYAAMTVPTSGFSSLIADLFTLCCLVLCCVQGNGGGVETPKTNLEHLFTLAVLLTGVTMYATLIGSVQYLPLLLPPCVAC
jgi:hypothetical protein